ncbi:MAG: serine protease [Oscillatoria princeps RMCB-10]|nr:serine protease [Oscillatoria princeps RMCB-10]
MVRRLSITVAIGLAVGGCSLLPLPKGDSPASSSVQVGNIAKEITVIIDGCGSGSGVLYKRQGKSYSVLTAKHTFNQPDAICLVIAPDGAEYRVNSGTVTAPVPGVDLAVLTFESDKTYKLAEWGDSEKATAGQIVYVAGAPEPNQVIRQRTFVLPEGKIMGVVPKPFEGYALLYDNPTQRGMSGGPVLDEAGRVIGIHGKGDRENGEKTGFNLGIPIQMFLKPDSQMAKGTQPEPAKDATAHFSQGFALEQQGDLKGALAEYSQAIAMNPNYADAYNNRGVVRYDSGDKPAALADYNEAIRINPNLASAYYNRGLVRYDSGDKPAALADYNQAIRINPNYADAYNNRGVVRYDSGDKPAALADYNQAIRINPNYADAYNNRGVVRYDSGDKPAALADYNEAIRINPNLASAYYNRGLVRYDSGDKPAALADYNQAIRINPNYADAYNNRGLVHYDSGDKPAALADYNQAIRINPNYAIAYVGRGNVRYNSGDKPAALADYNEAIRINPNYADAYVGRGVVRRDTGDKQRAREDFQKAADLYKQQGKQEWYQNSLNRLKELS